METSLLKQGMMSNDETILFDLKNMDQASCEDMLACVIHSLKPQVQAEATKLKSFTNISAIIMELKGLLKTAELLLMHFEFTFSILRSKTREEVIALKEDFPLIRSHYEKVDSKDDLTPAPAKYVLYVVYNKMLPKLKETLSQSFKKGFHGEVQVDDSRDCLIQITTMRKRFEYADRHYPLLITTSKNDIFAYERTSEVWRDLYESVTSRHITTDEEMSGILSAFYAYIYRVHGLVKGYVENKSTWRLPKMLSLAKKYAYYYRNPHRIEPEGCYNMLEPELDELVAFWNIDEHPVMSRRRAKFFPVIGHDECIYLPRLFPRITKESIIKEYEENSSNTISSVPITVDIISDKNEMLRELFIKTPDKISVRVFANEPLNLRGNLKGSLKQKVMEVIEGANVNDETAVVIHIHGGGFVALSSFTHKSYLARWVKNTKLIFFAIDYRLAPKNPYPAGFDDIWQTYLWIVNYAETILGIKTLKIIVSGDSAGGNFALTLALRLIRAGLKPPHGLLLIYPCLHMDTHRSSPSRFLHSDNPLLPTSFLNLMTKAYIEDEKDVRFVEDPFVSPLTASDVLLEKLPPIRMTIASVDPLHDDSWRLLARLRKLKKDVKMIVYDNVPHGYTFSEGLKNYNTITEDHCNLIQELVATEWEN